MLELHDDGKVDDSVVAARGFEIGRKVVLTDISKGDEHVYEIVSFKDGRCTLKCVAAEPDDTEAECSISVHELINNYEPYTETKVQVSGCTCFKLFFITLYF